MNNNKGMKTRPEEKINSGGIAAREGRGPLWTFLPRNDGSFVAPDAEHISRLYFPLMNSHGMKCSVTPELKGDILSSFEHYLTPATVTEELHRNVSSRNFRVSMPGHTPWFATGNSAMQKQLRWTEKRDTSEVEGRIGAFITRRENKDRGIRSEITVFVPDTKDHVELMKVCIKNVSGSALKVTCTAATPIFGRHADNFRDHRQVTTMFQKTSRDKHGVTVRPNIVHDEHGHAVNHTLYAVLGFEADGDHPEAVWPLMLDFIGEGGSLDNPEAVFRNLDPAPYAAGEYDGQEAVGAMRFR